MRKFKLTLVFLTLAISSTLLLSSIVSSHQYHKIKGEVLDGKNNPVANVWVRIYSGKNFNVLNEIGSDTTGDDGRYEIEFEVGDPITVIRYDSLQVDSFKRRHPVILSYISGKRDINIDKVMPGKVGSGLDKHALLEILSAYEHIYVIDSVRDLEGIKRELHDRYIQNLGMMKHVDPITEERIRWVKELYTKSQN